MECKYDDFVATVKALAVSSGYCPSETVDVWYQSCHIHLTCRSLAAEFWVQYTYPEGSQLKLT